MSQAVSTSGSLLSVIVNPGSGSPAECGVTYIESLDLANPAVLRALDSGSYVLYGKFKAYSGDDTIIVFESKLNANIVKSTDCSSIMIFNPVNSKVECLTIYDDRYERTDVALQDVVAHIGQLKNDMDVLMPFVYGKHAYGENIVVRSQTVPAGTVLGANSFNAFFSRRDVGASDSMLVLDCIAYLKAELEANETDYANISSELYFQAAGFPWGKGGKVKAEWGKPYWFYDTRRDVITGFTSNSLPGSGDSLLQIRTQQGSYTTTGDVTITYTALRLYVNGL